MMDMDAELIAEPFRPLLGIIAEIPEETPEEVAPPNCKIITVKKGGETMQFCVPAEGEK